MPNRILKDSICTSASIDGLTWFEEVFFYRLIVNCDDYGRMDARPAILRARLFPLKDVRMETVQSALSTLASAGTIEVYEVDGKPYLQMLAWDTHQTIRAKRSKYPARTQTKTIIKQLNTSEIICTQMQADAPVIQSESNPNPNPSSSAREDNNYDILTLTDEEKRAHSDAMEAIEQACRYSGMAYNSQIDLDTANDLQVEYTAAWVVDAIRTAKERGKLNWGYVKGVLRKRREQGGVDNANGNRETAPFGPGYGSDEYSRLDNTTQRL